MTFWNREPPKRATKAERALQSELETVREELERQRQTIRERDERIAILESEATVKDRQIKLLATIDQLNLERVRRAIRDVCESEPEK